MEEWERLCERVADEKLLPAVFFVWCLLAAPSVAMAAQAEPLAAPLGLWDTAGCAG